MSTPADRLSALEAELAALHARVRCGRWLAGTVCLAAVALAGAGFMAQPPASLEAQRFLVRGSDGTAKAVFGIQKQPTEEGAEPAPEIPTLSLLDDAGSVRMQFSVQQDGPQILLTDEDQTARVQLSGTAAAPGLTLFDAEGRPRSRVLLAGDTPAVVMLDAEGHDQASLTLLGGKPSLAFADAAGVRRALLYLEGEAAEPNLLFFDGSKSQRMELGIAGDGRSRIKFLDAERRPTAEIPPAPMPTADESAEEPQPSDG